MKSWGRTSPGLVQLLLVSGGPWRLPTSLLGFLSVCLHPSVPLFTRASPS